jgi:hypothetical protein
MFMFYFFIFHEKIIHIQKIFIIQKNKYFHVCVENFNMFKRNTFGDSKTCSPWLRKIFVDVEESMFTYSKKITCYKKNIYVPDYIY